MRILIAGGPKVGKTTLASKLAAQNQSETQHGDDLIATHEWSEASEEISTWFDHGNDFVIEGVQVPRALRKWLAKHPEGKPADKIYYSRTPRIELNKGQSSMLKGVEKVWTEILPELLKRGIVVESF